MSMGTNTLCPSAEGKPGFWGFGVAPLTRHQQALLQVHLRLSWRRS